MDYFPVADTYGGSSPSASAFYYAALGAGSSAVVEMPRAYKPRTFGRHESAVGWSVTINSGLGQAPENTSVLGTNAAGLAKYQDRDHVGFYVSASSFAATKTNPALTSYTATSITAPEISADVHKPGMIVDTLHAPRYVGLITSISGHTATVSGWFQYGSGKQATPSRGSGAVVNPNTKIWGGNVNLFLPQSGDAVKGVGIELGINAEKSGSGVNTWGYDAITLGGEKPIAHYISRGPRTISYLAHNSGGDFGFMSDSQNTGFESRDSKGYAYSAQVRGVQKWAVAPSGSVEKDFRTLRVATANGDVSDSDNFILVSGPGITQKLPEPSNRVGRVFTFKALAPFVVSTRQSTIDGAATKSVPANTTLRVISDGNFWHSF